MEIMLHVTDDRLEGLELQDITLAIAQDLRTHLGINADIPVTTQIKGTKGDLTSLGSIAIAVLDTGAIAALIGVLRAYLQRGHNFSVSIERPDGAKIQLSSENLSTGQMNATTKLVREFALNGK